MGATGVSTHAVRHKVQTQLVVHEVGVLVVTANAPDVGAWPRDNAHFRQDNTPFAPVGRHADQAENARAARPLLKRPSPRESSPGRNRHGYMARMIPENGPTSMSSAIITCMATPNGT